MTTGKTSTSVVSEWVEGRWGGGGVVGWSAKRHVLLAQ